MKKEEKHPQEQCIDLCCALNLELMQIMSCLSVGSFEVATIDAALELMKAQLTQIQDLVFENSSSISPPDDSIKTYAPFKQQR